MRELLKNLLPPICLPLLRRMDRRTIQYVGNYESWEEARLHSNGYEDEQVLERTSKAAQRVLSGDAEFERDTVCFDKPDFRWPLVASLMWAAAESRGNLDVVDFGGSLGSSYLQNRRFFEGLESLRWSIIEQRPVVERGKELFSTAPPEFHSTIEECPCDGPRQVLLLSSVLQYLQCPYETLEFLLAQRFPYVIIDRTPFMTEGLRDFLSVQVVPPQIYPASYPCWWLSLERFMSCFQTNYRFVAELPCNEAAPKKGCEFKGFVFARRSCSEYSR